jgi:hypothetical protein
MKRHILITLLFATILSSCSIEKRVYQPGYYISGRNSSLYHEDAPKRIKPIVSIEAKTIEKSSETVVVVTDQYSTSTLALDSSESTIDESITSNIHQTNKILTEINADTIPDEGKILLAKYEKNHAAKNKIRKIGYYPLTVAMYAFYLTWLIFLIYLFSTMTAAVLLASVVIFAAALILVIPLAIIYLVLSIITKKQRRKLRKLGVVK